MSAATSAERLSRMLSLVPWLIAHDGITIDEAARHFGVTPEQLEKDLWLLIVCGLPGSGPSHGRLGKILPISDSVSRTFDALENGPKYTRSRRCFSRVKYTRG